MFEGPLPPFTEVLTMVASKLSPVPRYRQKVRFVPPSRRFTTSRWRDG